MRLSPLAPDMPPRTTRACRTRASRSSTGCCQPSPALSNYDLAGPVSELVSTRGWRHESLRAEDAASQTRMLIRRYRTRMSSAPTDQAAAVSILWSAGAKRAVCSALASLRSRGDDVVAVGVALGVRLVVA